MTQKGDLAFPNIFALVSATTLGVQGTLLGMQTRDVYAPPVTYPRAGTVWIVGQKHNVTWDTKHHTVNITNKIGRIMLRKDNLTTPVILQENFSILLGKIQVRVPWVEDGDHYAYMFFGDSGNFSPHFTIKGL
ncbi:hypothetical protein C8R43DRAFT_1064138 [Mycena crocata]|nr:hypothetical protein C8R43DRAFT_1064138 [Mycena crocata]